MGLSWLTWHCRHVEFSHKHALTHHMFALFLSLSHTQTHRHTDTQTQTVYSDEVGLSRLQFLQAAPEPLSGGGGGRGGGGGGGAGCGSRRSVDCRGTRSLWGLVESSDRGVQSPWSSEDHRWAPMPHTHGVRAAGKHGDDARGGGGGVGDGGGGGGVSRWTGKVAEDHGRAGSEKRGPVLLLPHPTQHLSV